MNRTVAAVCVAVLVIAIHSEKCLSLEYNLENSDNVRNSQEAEIVPALEIPESYVGPAEQFNPVFNKLFRSNEDKKEDALDETDGTPRRRVARQAYQGQAPIYPNLPSGPPYGLEPYPSHNNQNPSYNPQWQSPYNNNHSQSGFPSQTNGYQPNHNNPYGTNTQLSHHNYTQPAYPNSNGNFTYNPSGPYGQSPQPNSWQPNPNAGQNPYNPSNVNYPSYNNNASSNPYPGYKPANTYNNNPTYKPPYNQPGQSQNNSYTGYPPQTQGYKPVNISSPYPNNPYQKPQYYPGQTQLNNTRYPQVVPGNQHPVRYDSTTRPGQNPYGSYNISSWSGNSLNNTQGRPPYNTQNGQSPQSFNSYPGYGSQNSTNPYNANQRSPYQDSSFNQNPPNGYPGHSAGSATFNTAHGYNPNIPNKPPHSNGSQYGNGSPYGNANGSPYGNGSPNSNGSPYGNGPYGY